MESDAAGFFFHLDWKLGDGYVTLNVDQATVDEMEETRKRYAAQYEIANYEGRCRTILP